MKNLTYYLFIICILIFIYGCASIISGTKQYVSINSYPSAAKVIVKTTGGIEIFNGATPVSVRLPRKNEYIVYVSLPGYKEQQTMISKEFNAWVIGNLVCGGVLGIVIDAVDGAMWNLSPETIQITLVTALKDGIETKYVIFCALDDQGQLRTLEVPLIPENM